LTAGCRVNPRAEREIALLRAEILDLEDQYYSLKSRCETGSPVGVGQPVVYDQGSNFVTDQGFATNQGFADPYAYSNPVIYQNAPGPVQGTFQNGSTEIVPFDDPGFETLPNEPVLDQQDGSGTKLESLPPAEGSGTSFGKELSLLDHYQSKFEQGPGRRWLPWSRGTGTVDSADYSFGRSKKSGRSFDGSSR